MAKVAKKGIEECGRVRTAKVAQKKGDRVEREGEKNLFSSKIKMSVILLR